MEFAWIQVQTGSLSHSSQPPPGELQLAVRWHPSSWSQESPGVLPEEYEELLASIHVAAVLTRPQILDFFGGAKLREGATELPPWQY